MPAPSGAKQKSGCAVLLYILLTDVKFLAAKHTKRRGIYIRMRCTVIEEHHFGLAHGQRALDPARAVTVGDSQHRTANAPSAGRVGSYCMPLPLHTAANHYIILLAVVYYFEGVDRGVQKCTTGSQRSSPDEWPGEQRGLTTSNRGGFNN